VVVRIKIKQFFSGELTARLESQARELSCSWSTRTHGSMHSCLCAREVCRLMQTFCPDREVPMECFRRNADKCVITYCNSVADHSAWRLISECFTYGLFMYYLL